MWQDEAACQGIPTYMYFPDDRNHPKQLRSICQSCPVRTPCAVEGLGEEFGMWGGYTSKEREELRRRLQMGKVTLPANPHTTLFSRYRPWIERTFNDARFGGLTAAVIRNMPDKREAANWLKELIA